MKIYYKWKIKMPKHKAFSEWTPLWRSNFVTGLKKEFTEEEAEVMKEDYEEYFKTEVFIKKSKG
jgi:hypothetical protein